VSIEFHIRISIIVIFKLNISRFVTCTPTEGTMISRLPVSGRPSGMMSRWNDQITAHLSIFFDTLMLPLPWGVLVGIVEENGTKMLDLFSFSFS